MAKLRLVWTAATQERLTCRVERADDDELVWFDKDDTKAKKVKR